MSYDVEIRQAASFPSEKCSQTVITFRMGPVVIRGAKVFEKDGHRWLSMPARKTSSGAWIDTVYIPDKDEKAEIEKAVFEALDKIDILPAESSSKRAKAAASV